jgi:hypothetical protein
MPPRVAAIKRAIQTRLNFSVLRDGGEAAVQAWGRACGMKWPNMLIVQWQDDYNRMRKTKPVVDDDESTPDDLGPERPDWPSDPLAPDDDGEDDEDEAGEDTEQLTRSCPKCRGLGRDSSGSKCDRCNGSGRIPANSVKEGDRHGGVYKFLYE